MIRAFWTICLRCCFAACGAVLINCTATQREAAFNAAKSACVVIDHVPTGSQMYVFVRPLADGGTE